jgi:hypothetical protein
MIAFLCVGVGAMDFLSPRPLSRGFSPRLLRATTPLAQPNRSPPQSRPAPWLPISLGSRLDSPNAENNKKQQKKTWDVSSAAAGGDGVCCVDIGQRRGICWAGTLLSRPRQRKVPDAEGDGAGVKRGGLALDRLAGSDSYAKTAETRGSRWGTSAAWNSCIDGWTLGCSVGREDRRGRCLGRAGEGATALMSCRLAALSSPSLSA